MRTLKSVMDTSKPIKIFESLPIAFIGEKDGDCESTEEAHEHFREIVRLLHKLHGGKNTEKIFALVDKEEFRDVTMWLSEKLWELNHSEERCKF